MMLTFFFFFFFSIGNSSIPLQYRNYWDVFQANNALLFPEEESYSDIFHVPQDVMKEFFTLIESSSNQPLRQIQFFVLLALVACYQLGVPSTLEQIFKQRNGKDFFYLCFFLSFCLLPPS